MNSHPDNAYWKAPTERDERRSEADLQDGGSSALHRRQFLEAAGFAFSLAALHGCGRAPTQTASPFVVQPEGVIPGRRRSYASTCAGCPAGCGLLVTAQDGRPIKMEGMPEHPFSGGGLCATGQAIPMGLYDRLRLRRPRRNNQDTSWEEVDSAMTATLGQLAANAGAIRFVTPTVTSPSLQAMIDSFLEPFGDARHVIFDAVSCSAILDAHQETHGRRVLPHFRLDQSKVIVSFGADFLGTWISPVEFTAAWRSRRIPTAERPEMSRHIQFEGRMSLAGSNADKRYGLLPDEYGSVLSHLAVRLSKLAQHPPPEGALEPSPIADPELTQVAAWLWDARGESVVISDSQDVAVQKLVNYVNHLLGNYGKTLDIQQPSRQRQGDDRETLRLIEDLKAGKVAALFVAGTDLLHNLPDRTALAEAIARVPLVVSFAERDDDCASLAEFVCPDHHPLESWLDAEPISGLIGIAQPTLQPLGETRSVIESLARWSQKAELPASGDFDPAYEIIRSTWRQSVLPRAAAADFQSFWDQSLHDGFAKVDAEPVGDHQFRAEAVRLSTSPPTSSLSLSLYTKVGLLDSRHAHNPWLQELPDPVTKVTWDNYVCVSPSLADEQRLTDGDLVRVESSDGFVIELPVFVQPGQHDRLLSIALGYGVRGTERFANIGPRWLESRPTLAAGERVGQNAAGLIESREGTLRYTRAEVTLKKTGGRRELASTQAHHTLDIPRNVAPPGAEKRDAIQETTLAAFREDHAAGTPEQHHHADRQLWPEDHPKTGHHWGMVIDLNACTGCSACLIACQSENNVPVVGKDEVRRQREMHWIRVDRYYSQDADDLTVSHQPMMCQHCDNAPCETVCPVLATVHGEGGLNQQAYNRCVGTRYCANNCPYKVRRFNWFAYRHDDPVQNLLLNPNVTVRGRGVMEKCSMCVQRIEEDKIEAKREGAPLVDGRIQTACEQSCPAQAIVFGDMNDAESRVSGALADPRRFRVLEEFNFRPSVGYLRIVRNRDASDAATGGEHV